MITGYENEDTSDIQHDLAMELARPLLPVEDNAPMIQESAYAMFKERLEYDLAEVSA